MVMFTIFLILSSTAKRAGTAIVQNSGNLQDSQQVQSMPQWIPGNYGNKSFSSRKMSPQRAKDLDESLIQQNDSAQHGNDAITSRPIAQLHQAMAAAASRSRSAPSQRPQTSHSIQSSSSQQHQHQTKQQNRPPLLSEAVSGGVENLTIAQLKEALNAIPSPIRHQLIGSKKSHSNMESNPTHRDSGEVYDNFHERVDGNEMQKTYNRETLVPPYESEHHRQQYQQFSPGEESEEQKEVEEYRQYDSYDRDGGPSTLSTGGIDGSHSNYYSQFSNPSEPVEYSGPNNRRSANRYNSGQAHNSTKQYYTSNGDGGSPGRRKAATPTQPRRGNTVGTAPATGGKQRAISAPVMKTPGRDQQQRHNGTRTRDNERGDEREGLILGATSGPNATIGLFDKSKGRSTAPRQDALEWSKNKAWDKHVAASGYFNNGQAQALPRSTGIGPNPGHLHLQSTSSSPDNRFQGRNTQFRSKSPDEQGNTYGQNHRQGGPQPNRDIIGQSLDYYRNRRQTSAVASGNTSPDPTMRFMQSFPHKSRSNTPNVAAQAGVSNTQPQPVKTSASPSFFDFMKSRNGNISPQRMPSNTQPPGNRIPNTEAAPRGKSPGVPHPQFFNGPRPPNQGQTFSEPQLYNQASMHGQPRTQMMMYPRGPPKAEVIQIPKTQQPVQQENGKFVFSKKPVNLPPHIQQQLMQFKGQQGQIGSGQPAVQQVGVRPNVPRLALNSGPTAVIASSGDANSREMKQVKSHTQQSHGPGEMTDVAEWQRFTTWLNSIGMGCYVTVLRDHGVTKLSIIELLCGEDLAQIGIAAQDIPIILRKVSELTQRIRSYSEQFAGLGGIIGNGGMLGMNLDLHDPSVDSVRQQPIQQGVYGHTTKPFRLQPKVLPVEESPIGPTNAINNDLHDLVSVEDVLPSSGGAANAAKIDLIKSLETLNITTIPEEEMVEIKNLLLESFDVGDNEAFFRHWDRLSQVGLGTDMYAQVGGIPTNTTAGTGNTMSPSAGGLDGSTLTVLTATKRPALLQAKQAMEFHLYLHFCIFPIKHNMSSSKVVKGKHALRKYLESLNAATNSGSINNSLLGDPLGFLTAPPSPIFPAEVGKVKGDSGEKVDRHGNGCSVANPINKSFTSSREFATYAGLVFVPSPQSNPAYQPLFRDEWTAALRSRLDQFIDVMLNAQSSAHHSNSLTANVDITVNDTKDDIVVETDVQEAKMEENIQQDVNADGDDERGVDDEEEEVSPLIRPKNLSSSLEIAAHGDIDDAIVEEDPRNGAPAVSGTPAAPNSGVVGLESCLSPNSTSSSISQLTDDTPLKNMMPSATSRDPHGSKQHIQGGKVATGNRSTPTGAKAPTTTGIAAPMVPSNSNSVGPSANQIMAKWAARQQAGQTGAPVALASSTGNGYSFATNPSLSQSLASKTSNGGKSALQAQVDNYNRLLRQNKLAKPTASPSTSPIHGQSQNVPVMPPMSVSSGLSANALLKQQNVPIPVGGVNQMPDANIAGETSPVTFPVTKIKVEDKVNKYKALLKDRERKADSVPVATSPILVPNTTSPDRMVFQSTASVMSQHSRSSRQSHNSTSKRSTGHQSHHSLHSSHKQVLNDPTHPINMSSDCLSPLGMVVIETRREGEDPVDTVLSPAMLMRFTPPSQSKELSEELVEGEDAGDPNERMVVDHVVSEIDDGEGVDDEVQRAEMEPIQDELEGEDDEVMVDVKTIDEIIDNIVMQQSYSFSQTPSNEEDLRPKDNQQSTASTTDVVNDNSSSLQIDEKEDLAPEETTATLVVSSSDQINTDDAVVIEIGLSTSDTNVAVVTENFGSPSDNHEIVPSISEEVVSTTNIEEAVEVIVSENVISSAEQLVVDISSPQVVEACSEPEVPPSEDAVEDMAMTAEIGVTENEASPSNTFAEEKSTVPIIVETEVEADAEVEGEDEPVVSNVPVPSSAAKKKKKKGKK